MLGLCEVSRASLVKNFRRCTDPSEFAVPSTNRSNLSQAQSGAVEQAGQHVLLSPCRSYSSAAIGSRGRDFRVASLCTHQHVTSEPRAREGGRASTSRGGLHCMDSCDGSVYSATVCRGVPRKELLGGGRPWHRHRTLSFAVSRSSTPHPRICIETSSLGLAPSASRPAAAPRCGPYLRTRCHIAGASCQCSRQSHTFGRSNQVVTNGSEFQIHVAPVTTISPEEIASIQPHAVNAATPRARCRDSTMTWPDSTPEIKRNQ